MAQQVKINITQKDVEDAYNSLLDQMNEEGTHRYSKSLYYNDVLSIRLETEISVSKDNAVDEAAVSALARKADVRVTRDDKGKVTSIVRIVPYTAKEIEQMKKDLADRKEDMEYQKTVARRRAERDGVEFDESMYEIDETIPTEREEWIAIPTKAGYLAGYTKGLYISYSLNGDAIGFDTFGGIDDLSVELEELPSFEQYKANFEEYLKSEALTKAFDTIKKITGSEIVISYI